MRSYSYCQKSWKNTKQSTTQMGLNRVSTLCIGLVPGLRMRACRRERSKSTTSTRGRTILRQKEYYLSASQARPMLTTGVVRSGPASVTYDETRVKSSCFHSSCIRHCSRSRSPNPCTLRRARHWKGQELKWLKPMLNAGGSSP